MNHRAPDQPHFEHPDVAGETQAWCSVCERDAEDCTCDSDFVRSSASEEDSTREGQASRSEHLAWCKRRALEYCNIGDTNQALASMGSDLRKHPNTANHCGMELGMAMLMSGHLNTPEKMRKFIEGFN